MVLERKILEYRSKIIPQWNYSLFKSTGLFEMRFLAVEGYRQV